MVLSDLHFSKTVGGSPNSVASTASSISLISSSDADEGKVILSHIRSTFQSI